MGVWMGVMALASWGAISAENVPDAGSPLEVIPSKRATQFLVFNEQPDYPSIARLNYIQGRVSVQTLVESSGKVKEAHVVKGHPFLAVAALKAIRNWIFKPAQSRQGPARFVTYVDVKFSLQARQLSGFPEKPESDMMRQVQPPELMDNIPGLEGGKTIRVRVLVGPDGRALDSLPLSASEVESVLARQAVANCTFRPARWGAIAVPWYLEIEVPIETSPSARLGLAPAGQ